MRWVSIGKAHWNTDNIQAFHWGGGVLQVWWKGEGEANPDIYKDPDRAMYNRLCLCLGLRPLEVAADGEG